MGIKQNPRPEADLTFLGLEIKTIPIGNDLSVLERTKINMLNFQDVVDHDFLGSNVEHKLRSIIFVPIVKIDLNRPEHWYIRSPFIWMPSVTVQAQFQRDYEEVRALLRDGRVNDVSSEKPPKGQGVFLIASTAGKDSKDVTSYVVGERKYATKRRAWMLRKEFTAEIIRENIAYRPVPVVLDAPATALATTITDDL